MPLPKNMIRVISGYYRELMGKWHYTEYLKDFDFIDDENLKHRLAQEFYIAKYFGALHDAMNFNDDSFEALGHLKVQIVQYAGIYEGVISYMLLNKFGNDKRVLDIQKKPEYKLVQNIAKNVVLSDSPEPLALCKRVNVGIDWVRINFEDKLNATIKIGFVKEGSKQSILDTYLLRHSVHVEKVVKDEIKFEKEQVRIAYETMDVFLSDIRKFLAQL